MSGSYLSLGQKLDQRQTGRQFLRLQIGRHDSDYVVVRLGAGRRAWSSPRSVLAGRPDAELRSTPANNEFARDGRLVELPFRERTHIRRNAIDNHIHIDDTLAAFLGDLGDRKTLDQRTKILRRTTDEISLLRLH